VQKGHTQRLVISGELGELALPIHHDDRKPSDEGSMRSLVMLTWKQDIYSKLLLRICGKLTGCDFLSGSRCIWCFSIAWLGSLERTLAEIMIVLELLGDTLGSRAGMKFNVACCETS
jgi:hypothetical protein